MNRHGGLLMILSVLLAVAAPRLAAAEDVEYIQALERAQKERPATLTAVARIAPNTEPGTPLVIHGRLFDQAGTSPVAGAIVFAYHTDREGLYHRRGLPPHSWRLRGWTKTDAEGRFEFHTIRPASYPSQDVPAHVHFVLFNGGERFHSELRFVDDPLVTETERKASRRDGDFGHVRPVRNEGKIQHADLRLRLRPGDRF